MEFCALLDVAKSSSKSNGKNLLEFDQFSNNANTPFRHLENVHRLSPDQIKSMLQSSVEESSLEILFRYEYMVTTHILKRQITELRVCHLHSSSII